MLLDFEITQTDCDPLGEPVDIYVVHKPSEHVPQNNLPPKFGQKRAVRPPVTSQSRYRYHYSFLFPFFFWFIFYIIADFRVRGIHSFLV